MALADIYQKATLVQIPSGYKAADAELYSVVPNTTAGDFTVSVDADATRVNKDGLIESVAANQARLDYNPTNPQDPTLLLEPQRTNQISKSRDLEGWSDLGGSETVTNNDAVAPNGANTAATIKKTGSDNSTLRFFTTHTNFSTVRSASVYIKKLSGNPTVSFGVTDTQVSITPTDKWVRYTKENVTPTNHGVNIFVDIEVSGVSGDKIAVWGAQLEEGTYSTSVIETTVDVLTRTADFCNIPSGLGNVLNTSEGTLFVDVEVPRVSTSSDYERIALTDQTSATDRILIDNFGGNWRVLTFSSAGTETVTVRSTQANTRIKIAFAYSSSQIRVSYDGNDATTTSISYTPTTTLETFKFSDKDGGNKWQGKIYQAMYFDTALTNAELKELTT